MTHDSHTPDPFDRLVYDELRRLAARYMGGERPGHTLQPTALVHEAYLRIVALRPAVIGSRSRAGHVAGDVIRTSSAQGTRPVFSA